jgi:hypothetical protein
MPHATSPEKKRQERGVEEGAIRDRDRKREEIRRALKNTQSD